MTVRAYSPRGDKITTAYLGYTLEVTNRDITVRDKHGRTLATVASMGAARRFLRGYRRDVPVKAGPAAKPATEKTAGPDKENVHA